MNIRIALPSKGRISGPSVELLEKAGIGLTDNGNRKLFSQTFDPEISVMFTRAADIPEYVADGAADMGMTGYDLIKEKNSDVEILSDLHFGQTNLVIATPESSEIYSMDDVKDGFTVATEFPNITKRYMEKQGKNIKILELSGATEIAPLIGVADIITDLSSTGTTLKMNHLRVIGTILESSIKLIANKNSLKEKYDKIEAVQTSIEGVNTAERKKLIMINIHKDKIEDVVKVLPGMSGPTISQIYSKENMVSVNAVISETDVFTTINNLRKLGGKDILVLPIERIMKN
ncbi:MAG: ATP phosphoribosyltransferase [Methanobacteriaceae archaeon]|nr:ATP phosphoribosyltransferase [Methanobacteriaceae archaeon]